MSPPFWGDLEAVIGQNTAGDETSGEVSEKSAVHFK